MPNVRFPTNIVGSVVRLPQVHNAESKEFGTRPSGFFRLVALHHNSTVMRRLCKFRLAMAVGGMHTDSHGNNSGHGVLAAESRGRDVVLVHAPCKRQMLKSHPSLIWSAFRRQNDRCTRFYDRTLNLWLYLSIWTCDEYPFAPASDSSPSPAPRPTPHVAIASARHEPCC